MREIIRPQLQLGELDIGAIAIDAKSRDDIPRLLRGLQHIYVTPELREPVFGILAEVLPQRADGEGPVSSETGRPGMTQWQILVLGTLRLGLNADYDRIQELANAHRTIRQMLGHSDWADETRWSVQTLKDNLRLFTPEVLERINEVVVAAGHALVKLARTTDSRCVVTPLSWRPTCTIPPTSTCSMTRCARSSRRARPCVRACLGVTCLGVRSCNQASPDYG